MRPPLRRGLSEGLLGLLEGLLGGCAILQVNGLNDDLHLLIEEDNGEGD
jgi:hypothetical protein